MRYANSTCIARWQRHSVATGDMIMVRNADYFGFEHHRPTASRRSVRIVPARANIVAVGIVAAAAAVVGAPPPRRRPQPRPLPPHRPRSGTIAVAPAAHGDSTAPVSPSCDRAAAIASRTHGTAAGETSRCFRTSSRTTATMDRRRDLGGVSRRAEVDPSRGCLVQEQWSYSLLPFSAPPPRRNSRRSSRPFLRAVRRLVRPVRRS
jgi:hypothetical protein